MSLLHKRTVTTLSKICIWQKLFILPFLLSCISIFLYSSPATGALTDPAISWSLFTSAGYIAPYTYLGNPISDHETSSDPTNGGAAVSPTAIDLASASPGAPPGTQDTPSFGYYDGGTAYDSLDPSTMEDDYIFFRMRLSGDPSNSGGFSAYHWNILLDIDDDGYKEYWVDLEGSYQSGGDKADRIQILYNNNNTQLVSDPDAARVEQFEARHYDNLTTYPNNHTRSLTVGDGSGDYWIEFQVPLTAFNDENGNQVVYPDSPVGFVFSTSASNTDPLQKDWMMDLDFLTTSDPITFGDVVVINGEPTLAFVDTSLEEVSFYTVGDNIYTYVKYPAGNTGSTTNESITVTITNPSTGDDEQLTLYESGPNSGLFTNNGGATTPVSSDATNGWLPYVTTSSTTDSAAWTLQYDNPSGTWLVYKDGVQQATYPAATTGTEYSSDNGEVTFTLYDLSPAHGDTITFTTYPADPLLSVADDLSYNNSDNDHAGPGGGLEVASGDTIQFSYTTPSVQTYTTQTNIVGTGVPFVEFTRANGLPSENFQLTNDPATSDQLYVTVTHPLSNTNPLVAETISVNLTGNDNETITLTETGLNTGIFRNTSGLQTQVDDGTPTGSLWEDIDEGIVTATYTYSGTPYSTTTQLFYVNGAGRVNFTNAVGTEDVELYVAGQSVYITAEDKNNTGSSSITVNVDSLTTGDNETITLYETSAGSGVFTNGIHNNTPTDLVTTSGSKIITSASSTFSSDGVQVGDTITIFNGSDAGEYIVESLDSETQITLTTTLTTTDTGITGTAEQPLKAGTLSGSTTDDDGVLELVHDETLQVSYTDADDGDSNSSNDVKTDTATYKAPPVVINEVFFYPDATASYAQTEYFEIYNASGSSIDIKDYYVTDGDTFSYTFPDGPGETGAFTLDPGEKAYIFLYENDLSSYNYYDSGTDINYLFAVSGDVGVPSDQFGDPGDPTSENQADQLLLYNPASEIQDYVGWSYVIDPSLDFLGDDSPAVSDSIWQDDAFRDVSTITSGKAIGRISDGYDTDVPSDWTYPVDPSSLFGPGGPLLTPVIISSFQAFEDNGRVILHWETASESGTVGFYIYRRAEDQFMYELVNKRIIPSFITNPQGGTYQLHDKGAVPGKIYSYLLEEIVTTGERLEYGPFEVNAVNDLPDSDLFNEFSRKPRNISKASQKRNKSRSSLNNNRSQFAKKSPSRKRGRHNSLGNQPDALLVSITETGLYHISQDEIAKHFNLKPSYISKLINKSKLRLESQGLSVPYFSDWNNSGIYFYGVAYNDIFTRENVYWLMLEAGRKMSKKNLNSSNSFAPDQSFKEIIHVEEDYWPALAQPWNDTEDYWIWDYAFSGIPEMSQLTFNFQVSGVSATSQNGFLTINFVGGSVEGGGEDHLAEVLLNDSLLGECSWEGIELFPCTLPFRQDILNEGNNDITINGILIGDAGFSFFFVDSFDVEYQRYYEAVDNSLHFDGDGNRLVTVSGFDEEQIYLLDVSNPDWPILLENKKRRNKSTGSWLSFSPGNPKSSYFALSHSAIKQVDTIGPYNFTGLKDRRNLAQYLIITSVQLSEPAQELASYRSKQGLKTKIVHLEDIIAEFNHGIYSPYAIKNFLAYAFSTWIIPPEYAVLVGDATYDYRDLMGHGGNILPTIFVSTPHGLFASDNHLADIDNDGVPDMAIGRLPVVSEEELMNILQKIVDYEALAGLQGNKVLLLADESGDNVDFATDSDRISRLFPDTYFLEKIYLSDYSFDYARQKLLDGLKDGAAFFNFFGHSGIDQITTQGVFHSDDLENMNTNSIAPVVTAMTCTIGQFTFPFLDTLAELMVIQPNGGATAIWSPSSLSENSEARLLDSEFYRAIYRDGETILGKAINKAFYQYSLKGEKPYHILTYNLLGDPALKVN